MSRLPALDPTQAASPAKELLEKTQAQLGRIPNLYRAMAHAPAALDGYLQFRASLIRGRLGAKLREQLALVVAQENRCGYCVSAHVFRGSKMGMSPEELEYIRQGVASDPKVTAALRFAKAVTAQGGQVSNSQLEEARSAGWSDGEIAEIVAHVALNTYSNIFSHVAEPELDFPDVEVSHA